MNKKLGILFFLLLQVVILKAQTYCGEHKYDGEHKNEVEGYLQPGDNIITGKFIGVDAFYRRHLTDRWTVKGGLEAPIGKGKMGVEAKGSYRLPWKIWNFYVSGKVLYNRYFDYGVNEINTNVSVTAESPYFDLTVGQTLINYYVMGTHYREPLTLTFGTGVNIRPRWNSWNLGLFFRNYDDFYYENWNINWGLRWNASLQKNMKLFGELNIRPAGSMSQLASKYETSLKLGLKYAW